MNRDELQKHAKAIVEEFREQMAYFEAHYQDTHDEDGQGNAVWLREVRKTCDQHAEDLLRYIED